MGYWVVATVVSIIALEAVVVALLCVDRSPVRTPRFRLLDPRELHQQRFARTCRGYDPEQVDVAFRELRAAYTALFDAGDDDTREEARRRLDPDGQAAVHDG